MLRSLTAEDLELTASWVSGRQRPDGAIPWFPGRKLDPWDHVQSAMALAVSGRHEAAKAAYRFLARTQLPGGGWPSASTAAAVLDPTRETNYAAYVATGLWHLHRSHPDPDFLAEMWPALERAIGFVVGLQGESGAVWWAADGNGLVWPAPLLTGCASIHGSLLCAVRIAERLGHDRTEWRRARERLAEPLRNDNGVFHTSLQEPGRFSMDWYYPVLGGAVRGEAGRQRFFAWRNRFIGEGLGCRCVVDRPWYTVAETCELIIALDTCGLTDQARALLDWAQTLREPDGGYWMGITYPQGIFWPPERPSWTAATVILAADALAGDSPTSAFFRQLGEP